MRKEKFAAVSLLFWLSCICLQYPISIKAADLLREVKVGVLDHDVSRFWGGNELENGGDINGEFVFAPSFHFLKGAIRPNLGFSINTDGYTSKVYGGGVWEYVWKNGLFADLGLGLALHDGLIDEDGKGGEKELGSRVLFRFVFEGGFTVKEHHRFSVMFDHISNGYLADPNDGLDTLGFRYGYLF